MGGGERLEAVYGAVLYALNEWVRVDMDAFSMGEHVVRRNEERRVYTVRACLND